MPSRVFSFPWVFNCLEKEGLLHGNSWNSTIRWPSSVVPLELHYCFLWMERCREKTHPPFLCSSPCNPSNSVFKKDICLLVFFITVLAFNNAFCHINFQPALGEHFQFFNFFIWKFISLFSCQSYFYSFDNHISYCERPASILMKFVINTITNITHKQFTHKQTRLKPLIHTINFLHQFSPPSPTTTLISSQQQTQHGGLLGFSTGKVVPSSHPTGSGLRQKISRIVNTKLSRTLLSLPFVLACGK